MNQCKQVIDDHSLADSILPTVSGFFFGDTSYDEYYFQDIEYTYGGLKKELESLDPDSEVIYKYESSW